MKCIGLFIIGLISCSIPVNAQMNKANVLTGTHLLIKSDSILKFRSLLPGNFATCNYGFFCKQELKLEKQIHVPLKFRLGSIEYTNWLEGKSRFKPLN